MDSYPGTPSISQTLSPCHPLQPQPRGPAGAEGRSHMVPGHAAPRTYRALLPAAPLRREMDGAVGFGRELLLSQQQEVTRLLV